MKELEAYKEMLKKTDSFLNKKGSLRISKFIRSSFDNIKEIQERGFQLKEIASGLSEDLNSEVNYASFWSSIKRHSERIKRKKTILFKESEKEKLSDDVSAEKEKPVSDEIKDLEKDIELDWINKPEFRQINNPHLIKEIINYELTEDDIRSLNLPPHPIKCLELITDLGERRKAEKIDKIYFGK